ncbi:hypothetical protein F3Y22_tig00110331pilonHSYRG00114 [Hibiscus syriacus]|uniref:Late embryogenesis abundant protein LEA-2 subgroup domain-containing protein n=1 Tax=Hibiscus syriacus TaxID=106335 RepID=A0A6A3AXF2_HIBSY|nr:hypothetical protein F3Y22_tig00110331pilonHSYRG00114 [Hibiscus syriacus]
MEDERVVASSTDTRLLSSTPHAATPVTMNLPPPPGHPLATYVVQVPKDQIYRVPPPENDGIVNRYREAAKAKGKKRKGNFCNFFLLFVVGLLLLGGSPPTYDVTLKAKNLNEKMGIQYKSDKDGASLDFWIKNLGFGDFPGLKQEAGVSSNVNIKIHGLKSKTVPLNVQKSISDKMTKRQISLKLKLESPLVFNVWILKLWKRDLDVNCDFRVSTLAEGTKILSQKCKTKMS